MKKADYTRIASLYDKGRSLSEQNIEMWLKAIGRLSGGTQGSRVLDLGCGTGRFSIPMASKLGYQVTGADLYVEMLDIARQKDTDGLVQWDRQDAQDLTYPDGSFDVVFMSHLLHHCDTPDRVISESLRVLTGGGAIVIRYGAIEQIRDDIEHTFFPETLDIDLPRIISTEQMEYLLRENGFSEIISEEIVQQTYETAAAHLEACKVKNTSVLTMISEEAYQQGLQRLGKYLEDDPQNPRLLYDKMTLTAGYKTK